MIVAVLGCDGSIGRRHYLNVLELGHRAIGYDLGNADSRFPHEHRKEVLDKADAIIVATPSECHLDDLRDCVALGKAVLVEKPLCLIGQYHKAAEICNGAKNPIAIGYNLRFSPEIERVKRSLKDHMPFYVSVACCQYTESIGPLTNGCINDWSTHEID